MSIRTNIDNLTFNPANLTTADYKLGWTKHWLRSKSSNTNTDVTRLPLADVISALPWFSDEDIHFAGAECPKATSYGIGSKPLLIATIEDSHEKEVAPATGLESKSHFRLLSPVYGKWLSLLAFLRFVIFSHPNVFHPDPKEV